MKAAEWHLGGRSGDFIVKKNPPFHGISKFQMGGYFLKTCFLNR